MQHPPGILGEQWIADEMAKARRTNATAVRLPRPERQVAPETMERLGVLDTHAGRDPRFPPGWWIVPGMVLGLAAWVALIAIAARLAAPAH